jgi:arsenate reductase
MQEPFAIIFYHNPACGTSRNALAMVEAAGYTPTIIEYLKTGWTRQTLLDLLDKLKCGPRDILRDKGTPAGELGLLNPAVDDTRILDAMVAHPILVNRPIVVTPLGARLARPSEIVCEILARKPGSFTKEDGQTVEPR